ncbi:MAG: Error-prone repair protein ImuA [Chitinophagia bacterium]|nr:Error-prone repair protein ImuA [Chitinophagia bacterium]
MQPEKCHIIEQLQKEVLSLQRPAVRGIPALRTGLWEVERAFPGNTFPLGAVHEFVSNAREDAAATNGFMAGLMSHILKGGTAIWVSARRTLFPPALALFGIAPERIIFIDVLRQKEVLWAVEEALRCAAVQVVVGELGSLSFTESRRLQLAVEQSQVTGLLHRYAADTVPVTACVSRWHIKPAASQTDGLPGMGFPRWNVQLLKVRNGKPGAWQVEWVAGAFRQIALPAFTVHDNIFKKAG